MFVSTSEGTSLHTPAESEKEVNHPGNKPLPFWSCLQGMTKLIPRNIILLLVLFYQTKSKTSLSSYTDNIIMQLPNSNNFLYKILCEFSFYPEVRDIWFHIPVSIVKERKKFSGNSPFEFYFIK